MSSKLMDTLKEAVLELEAVVGEGKAFPLLDRKLQAMASPVAQLYAINRLDILVKYLSDGARISQKEIDALATQQTYLQIRAALTALKTELGA
jgi:hypothetical protein